MERQCVAGSYRLEEPFVSGSARSICLRRVPRILDGMDLGLAPVTRSRAPSIPTRAFRRLRRVAATGVEKALGGLALSELQYRLDARLRRQRPPGYNADYWRWF